MERLKSSLLDHARHLAEGMWTPTLVIGNDGTLLFINEGAEVLLGRRADDLCPILAADWGRLFNVRGRDGTPFPLDAMPGWIALQQSQPAHGHVRFTSADGLERYAAVTGIALFTQLGEFEGALVHMWEDEEGPGQTLEATLMFCDLRGYTAKAGELEPSGVKELLTVYYDHASRLISRHGGSIIAFTGDEVFAAWGVPVPDDGGPDRAVACGRLVQDSVEPLNRRLSAKGLPTVGFGIGIHKGEVLGAHVGFGSLRQFTVTGDAVNCASRLCDLAGRNEIVVSRDVLDALTERPQARALEGMKLKGVKRDLGPHQLWPDELYDPTGSRRRADIEALDHEAVRE